MFDKRGTGTLTWRELGILMDALGFPNIGPGNVKRANIAHDHTNSVGLDYKEFNKLLHSEEMQKQLDYTCNKHNFTYNIRAIKRAIDCLVQGSLSLAEIKACRMAFKLYEGEFASGIQMDEKVLLRSLKLSGKTVAPARLQLWMSEVKTDMPGRLQLYEYFQLNTLCEGREESLKHISPASMNINKGRSGLYELADPDSFLLNTDQKLLKKVGDDYESKQRELKAQKAMPKSKPATIAPMPGPKDAVEETPTNLANANETYRHIKHAIQLSNRNIMRSKARGEVDPDLVHEIEEEESLVLENLGIISGKGKKTDSRGSTPGTPPGTLPPLRQGVPSQMRTAADAPASTHQLILPHVVPSSTDDARGTPILTAPAPPIIPVFVTTDA